jgi:hypothetical protein
VSSWTTIGATYFAADTPPARAFARAPTVTDSMPKMREKKPGAGAFASTVIVSTPKVVDVRAISVTSTLPPFFSAYSSARSSACTGFSGSACAPARAAASTVA